VEQPVPRVAFLTDTFHEVNGAARTCREFAAFAKRRGYPFFSVRFARNESAADGHPFRTMELMRSRLGIGVDPDLRFDLLFYRHRQRLLDRLREFSPDLIHVIGPGELGILGAIAAHHFGIPLAVGWHTNVHEYAGRRMPFGSARLRSRVESFVLDQVLRLYRRGEVLFAPSPELVDLLHSRTGKPALLMTRGVDTSAFSPEHRQRNRAEIVIGYVGRLMREKRVRFFARLEQYLSDAGERNFRVYMAGWGSEERWLRAHLRHTEFDGILDPKALGRAYANLDLFVFPSRTDTFGNVVQEALASGVPAIVSDGGGPKTIVDHGRTGLIASSDEEMCGHVLRLMRNPLERAAMGAAGRASMLSRSWDRVFEDVYQAYGTCLARR